MRKMEKKGLTAQTLIGIILLLLAFVILLFVYFQIKWTGRVNKEVCHESVIFRATLPSLAGAKEYIPLKCKTDKICITTGLIGGKCDEFGDAKGVTKVKVKNKEQIEKFLAQEIIDCWSTMGEGKVSIFSQWLAETYGVGGVVYPSCVICSRIAFDKTGLEKAEIDLRTVNITDYMHRYIISGKDKTYYDYLAGEGGKISIKEKYGDTLSVSSIDEEIEGDNKKPVEGQEYKLEISEMEEQAPETGIYEKELAIMFMQISAPEHGGVIKNTIMTALGTSGGSFFLAPFTTLKLAKGVIAHPVLAISLAVALGAYQQGSVAYNRAITAGYCGDVMIGSKAGSGCSVVRTVNYDVEDISQYCSVIESIP